MTRHMLSLGLGLALLAGCQADDSTTTPTSDDGPIGCTPEPAPYPNDTSPVIGAYLTRVERSLTPEQAAAANLPALWDRARGSASTTEVEHERALLAIDMLARRYLRIWLDAAAVAPADWADQLPAGQLTPEQVSKATADALVLVTTRHEALAPASWDPQWDATASAVHEAQFAPIPGLPQEWYGADNAFRASWIAARIAADGAATFDEAFGRIAAPAVEVQTVSFGFVDELVAVGE
jgi:hypothetical protein